MHIYVCIHVYIYIHGVPARASRTQTSPYQLLLTNYYFPTTTSQLHFLPTIHGVPARASRTQTSHTQTHTPHTQNERTKHAHKRTLSHACARALSGARARARRVWVWALCVFCVIKSKKHLPLLNYPLPTTTSQLLLPNYTCYLLLTIYYLLTTPADYPPTYYLHAAFR